MRGGSSPLAGEPKDHWPPLTEGIGGPGTSRALALARATIDGLQRPAGEPDNFYSPEWIILARSSGAGDG